MFLLLQSGKVKNLNMNVKKDKNEKPSGNVKKIMTTSGFTMGQKN